MEQNTEAAGAVQLTQAWPLKGGLGKRHVRLPTYLVGLHVEHHRVLPSEDEYVARGQQVNEGVEVEGHAVGVGEQRQRVAACIAQFNNMYQQPSEGASEQ